MLQKTEIYCSKFGYSEVTALDIAHCTFARVWKYPKFSLKKAKSKDVYKAVLLWLYPIMFTQLVKYKYADSCADPTLEEDLCIVTDLDELVDKMTVDEDAESKKSLKQRLEMLNGAFAGLSEKHRIIYLTYKAYETKGKNIPRPVSKQLQETLQLVPITIRIYKRDANLYVENYIKQRNARK